MIASLHRYYHTDTETLGTIALQNVTLYTLELPWMQDKPDQSCVPAGFYNLIPHQSDRLHEQDGKTPLATWLLVNQEIGVFASFCDIPATYSSNFPARYAIEIHPANWASELEGCIAPGIGRQMDAGTWMLTQSGDAFIALRSAFGGAGTRGNGLIIEDTNG